MSPNHKKRRIGFISTRLSGTDGVSLETQKWVKILSQLNCKCFFFAGESEWPSETSYVVEEAHFDHPDIRALTGDLFDNYTRSSETSGKIQSLRLYLKQHLYQFINQFDIDLIVVENALSIPMNIPLGLAITELIAELNIPTIAHHHDFSWERSRFKVSSASDYQFGAFPPILPFVHHVVINSYASRQLALRTGASSTLIPNVMDFETPPQPPDKYSNDLRQNLGIKTDEFLILQPTRVVPRKRIELAVELIRRLEMPCALVVSHSSGDEGTDYKNYLSEYSRMMEVRLIFAGDRINHIRGTTSENDKIYSLRDIYQHADLVTFPSTVEGFGNAFLESIYYNRPIVISTYEIFRSDIQPKGFQVIGFGNFITGETVRKTKDILKNRDLSQTICQHNYELGRRHFSYTVLKNRLRVLIDEALGLGNS